jgi:hypothetical protein
MDIDHIAPAEYFIDVIQEKLSSVQVAVVLIGKQWLDIKDTTGQRRLNNPGDFVCIEIAALLKRKNRVIPVLVGGAIVPSSSQLPEPLVSLVRQHTYEISDVRFHSKIDKLIQVLKKIVGVQIPPKQTEQDKEADPEDSVSSSCPKKKKIYVYIAITIISAIVLFIVMASTLQYISSFEEGLVWSLQSKQNLNQMNRR